MQIEDYSDEELIEWLDLNHPTDRELEAKIIQLIRKYETTKNNEMKQFLMEVYERFFDTKENEEEDVLEGFENDNKNPDVENQDVVLSKNIDYTQGLVNPLLKETITRIVSIDSQFRDDTVYKYSTNFTFNLSETLKNVVSLKLYSIQIPYTWYIISDNYGSNFFYLQGSLPGIDRAKYTITVNNGNTTVDKLITDINNSISTIQSTNPDVSFGTTGITYNANDTRATLSLNIKNTFTTQYYSIEFPSNDSSSTNTIYDLFGFQNNVLYPFRIYSTKFILPTFTTPFTTPIDGYAPTGTYYVVDDTNNYFDIKLYQSVITTSPIYVGSSILVPQSSSFDAATSTIQKTIRIQLSLKGQYNAQQILNDVNYQLQNNSYLENDTNQMYSKISLEQSNNAGQDNVYQYYLQLRVKRSIGWSSLDENVKMVVVFPNVTNTIWTGSNSCFKFVYSANGNEMNNSIADNSIGNTDYVVSSSPYILLRCNLDNYGRNTDGNLNNIKINIQNSTNYTLNDYYNAINTGIKNYTPFDLSFNGYCSGGIDNVLVDKNYYPRLSFNILKILSTENFIIDLSYSILQYWGFSQYLNGDNNGLPYVIKKKYLPNGETVNEFNNTIYVKPTNNNSYCTFPEHGIPITICQSQTTAISAKDIISKFNENLNIFASNNLNLSDCNVLYELNTETGIETITFYLNIQAVLKENDYIVELGDTTIVSSSSWSQYFGFDPYYSLVHQNSFTGTIIINNKTITLDNSNNYFNVKPIYNPLGGVYDSTLYHMKKVVLDLPINKVYTTDDIRNSINRVMNVPNSILYGSFLNTNGLYPVWIWNINKTFRTQDYKLVFFDNTFVQCNYGESASVTNTTADTTLGWLLGYRSELEYLLDSNNLSTYTNLITNEPTNNIINNTE